MYSFSMTKKQKKTRGFDSSRLLLLTFLSICCIMEVDYYIGVVILKSNNSEKMTALYWFTIAFCAIFYFPVCEFILDYIGSYMGYVRTIVYISVGFAAYFIFTLPILVLYCIYRKDKNNYRELKDALEAEKYDFDVEFQKKKNEWNAKTAELESKVRIEKNAIDSTLQSYPFLSSLLASHYQEEAEIDARLLVSKRLQAVTASYKLREYGNRLKTLSYRAKLAENQLLFFESLFPWLEDFKDLPPLSAYDIANNTHSEDPAYSPYKKWLSPEEYKSLPPVERNQLALDRYKERQKNSWETYIEYERFVAYKYKMHGFKVTHSSAIKKQNNIGRYIIAEKDKKTYIIQCKNRDKEYTIHENLLFQLHNTSVLYKLNHTSQEVQPLFVTTTDLSPTATQVADHLDISVVRNFIVDDYPLVKCSIDLTGKRVYHLPFDQKYDSITISPDKGEGFAYTVAEAQEKGFQHASIRATDDLHPFG